MADNTPVRYSWNYEDYSDQMVTRFGKLLQSQTLVDMTLMCSTHTLRVHRLVLAASSPYFQEILENQTGEPVVTLKMRFEILKSLVEFMYCGKTSCLEGEIDELVSAAQFLRIKGLSKVTKEGLGIADKEELPEFAPPVVISKPPLQPAPKPVQESVSTQTSPRSSPPKMFPEKHNEMLSMPTMSQFYPQPPQLPSPMSFGSHFLPPPTPTQPLRGEPHAPGNLFFYNSVLRGGYSLPKIMRRGRGRVTATRGGPKVRGLQRLVDHRFNRNISPGEKYPTSCYANSQDYVDNVALNRAIQSICEPGPSHQNYGPVTSPTVYGDRAFKKKSQRKETPQPGSYYSAPTPDGPNPTKTMTQYINKLKKAGLPTDLPILFQSSDGSYVNVNEQVLLDMVQSNEIQYEVIEEPIIDKFIDPNQTKSIDDLSKSLKTKTNDVTPKPDYIELTNVIPEDLRYEEGYVVTESKMAEFSNENSDFACIDGEMQYFTDMNNDVKKYYEEQNLGDPDVMAQICGSSSSCEVLIEPIDLLHIPNHESNISDARKEDEDKIHSQIKLESNEVIGIKNINNTTDTNNVENFINGSVIFKPDVIPASMSEMSDPKPMMIDPELKCESEEFNTSNDTVLDSFETNCDDKENIMDVANLKDNIPLAVGLLPLKSMNNILEPASSDDDSRKNDDYNDDIDAKCLKRRKRMKRST